MHLIKEQVLCFFRQLVVFALQIARWIYTEEHFLMKVKAKMVLLQEHIDIDLH